MDARTHGSRTRTSALYEPVMDADAVNAYLSTVYPQSDSFDCRAEQIRPGEVTVAMRVTDNHLRPGGTVSGPSMFALADLAAYLLVLSHVGEVALAVTTNLTINFLSKPPQADLYAEGRLLKLGKRLAICEIHIHSRENDLLVAQATATYSIPPR